jgi:ankyrin repeat protein
MADESLESFEIRRYTNLGLGPQQMYFKACLVPLRLHKDHVADAGLEFKIDFAHGHNTARFSADADIAAGSDREAAILLAALRVIGDDDSRAGQGDGESVRAHLSAAGAWGDAELVTQLLRTCYVTASIATAVLFEVASTGGSEAVVATLLAAGADGFAPLAGGRTAFHAALANGHEHCGNALLAAAPSRAAATRTTAAGDTACDLAVAADFGGVARRARAKIEAAFPETAAS